MTAIPQLRSSRPHFGIVLLCMALFLLGCSTPQVPRHLEVQGWRLATLWSVRSGAEFQVPAATLDCRRLEDSTAQYALVSYRSNHRSWILLMPAGGIATVEKPRFVYVKPNECKAPVEYDDGGPLPIATDVNAAERSAR